MSNPLADKKARAAYNKALREKGVAAKACSSCFAVKALTQFNKAAHSADGRQSRCRDCTRAADAQWYSENADRKREYDRRYRAENAEAQREYARKYHAEHAESRREYKRQWREANPEYGRLWRAANPDKARANDQRKRARKAAATIEDFAMADLFAAWDDAAVHDCYLCGLPFGEEDEVHLDHVIPLSGGGTHEVANLLPAHDRCNLTKNAADPLKAWHRIQRETHGDAEAEARMRYVKAHTA